MVLDGACSHWLVSIPGLLNRRTRTPFTDVSGSEHALPCRCGVWAGTFDITCTLHKQNLLRPGQQVWSQGPGHAAMLVEYGEEERPVMLSRGADRCKHALTRGTQSGAYQLAHTLPFCP